MLIKLCYNKETHIIRFVLSRRPSRHYKDSDGGNVILARDQEFRGNFSNWGCFQPHSKDPYYSHNIQELALYLENSNIIIKKEKTTVCEVLEQIKGLKV